MHTSHHRQPVPARVFEADRVYSLVAVDVGDDQTPQRPILVLRRLLPLIEILDKQSKSAPAVALKGSQLGAGTLPLAPATGLSEAQVRALWPLDIRQPHPLLRPIVVRATLGERLLVSVTNRLSSRPLSMALIDDNQGLQECDDRAPLSQGESRTYLWHCRPTGVYPIYNRAAASMAERRCLLGVLIVEP